MELAAKRFADTVALYPTGPLLNARHVVDFLEVGIAHHRIGDRPECRGDGIDEPGLAARGLEIDLAGVEYISSVGLRVLMLASKQVKAQGGALAVADLQPVVREIFEISRFNLVLEVFPTLREALAKLSPAALAAFEAA